MKWWPDIASIHTGLIRLVDPNIILGHLPFPHCQAKTGYVIRFPPHEVTKMILIQPLKF